jgi:hypothetical protein
MATVGAPGADWVGMNTQSTDDWLATAAAEALEAIADIHAAGQEDVTQASDQRANRASSFDAGSDADLEALHQEVVRARRARAQARGPNE